jgi:hypothetical protein
MFKSQNINNKQSNQQGVTLLLSILLLAAIMAISFSLTTVLFIEIRSSNDLLRTEGALYGATGIGEQALFNLKRQACNGNAPNCYTANYTNNVVLSSNPQEITASNPIFNDKVVAGSDFDSTQKKYDFCGTSPNYDAITNLVTGCGYGKVTINYIATNNLSDSIKVYLCEWDPNSTYLTSGSPCSVPGSASYWKGPCTTSCDALGTGIKESDGSVILNSGVSNTASWSLNPNLQQQLIVVNSSGSNDVYYSVASYDADMITPKGLPFVGKTAITISTSNSGVGRRIQVNVPKPANQAGSANGFGYSRQISIASSRVSGGGPFTNFPVLFDWTHQSLKSYVNGGKVEDDFGKDIIFTSDALGAQVLPFELEKYDPVTGHVMAWVNVPSLTNTSSFYIYYGKSGATDQSNITGTWNSGYRGVWHFNDTSSPSRDSTSFGNNAAADISPSTNPSFNQTGKINGSVSFNASANNALSASTNLPTPGQVLTWEGWINGDMTTPWQVISAYSWVTVYDGAFSINTDNSGFTGWGPGLVVRLQGNSTSNFKYVPAPASNTWHHLVVVIDNNLNSSNEIKLYINGVLQAMTTYQGQNGDVTGNWHSLNDKNIRFGKGFPNWDYWSGKLDEIRISSVARSSDWVITSYNNQSAPASFYTVGSEQVHN